MMDEGKSATPSEILLSELMDSRVPKTEREHFAAREINRLRASAGSSRKRGEEMATYTKARARSNSRQ